MACDVFFPSTNSTDYSIVRCVSCAGSSNFAALFETEKSNNISFRRRGRLLFSIVPKDLNLDLVYEIKTEQTLASVNKQHNRDAIDTPLQSIG